MFCKKNCQRRDAWVGRLLWCSCHSPVAYSWINQIISMKERSSRMQNLMQICCSYCSVILNVMATQCTCSLNSVYCPHCIVQWSYHCSHTCIPIHSLWLPGYTNVVQTALVILTVTGIFPDRPHMSDCGPFTCSVVQYYKEYLSLRTKCPDRCIQNHLNMSISDVSWPDDIRHFGMVFMEFFNFKCHLLWLLSHYKKDYILYISSLFIILYIICYGSQPPNIKASDPSFGVYFCSKRQSCITGPLMLFIFMQIIMRGRHWDFRFTILI